MFKPPAKMQEVIGKHQIYHKDCLDALKMRSVQRPQTSPTHNFMVTSSSSRRNASLPTLPDLSNSVVSPRFNSSTLRFAKLNTSEKVYSKRDNTIFFNLLLRRHKQALLETHFGSPIVKTTLGEISRLCYPITLTLSLSNTAE